MKHPEIEVRPRDRREGRGLDATDRAYLGILADAGQPVGLGTVAAVLGEEEANVSEVVESYLLRAGLIVKGPRGRSLTEAGRQYHQPGRK